MPDRHRCGQRGWIPPSNTEEIRAKIRTTFPPAVRGDKVGEIDRGTQPQATARSRVPARTAVRLSAKVLRWPKSVYYAVSGGVTEIAKAVKSWRINAAQL